ncbi:MAG: ATP-binding cassette domain-containing protein [Erysipelotrichaceae bacterium]|jgi:Fe-S cluster assembly ATP-binding protein|nr:ATP-binding cassette domain-containing protein [Erysipelotrichaceae bacterium]
MLELQHLSFSVEGKDIIQDISAVIEDNGFTVITGPNGGGKSTLAKLIMGIEKPTSGKILFNGIDITDMDIHERSRHKIGYAFQQPPRFKGMTVSDLLSIAHGTKLSEDHCCSYLSDVGLCSKDYLHREVDASLSGGEVKRIEIATLLARDLQLAIFDEPEAGIDLWSFAKLVETFQNMQKKKQLSVILISHQERIMQLADTIMIIENGRVKHQGAKESVLPELMQEFDCRCCKE